MARRRWWRAGAAPCCIALCTVGAAAAAVPPETGGDPHGDTGAAAPPAPPPVPDATPPAPDPEPPASWRIRGRHSQPSIAPPPAGSSPTDTLFPAHPRPLRPYLQMADRFGTHALRSGALITSDPVSDAVQAVKTELGNVGLRYSFEQNLIMTSMSDRVQGDAVLGAYEYSFFGNWTIFESTALGGTCGWLTAKTVGTIGLNFDAADQSPRSNIGAAVEPNNNYHHVAVAMEQLAWAQSFADGSFVVMAGMINQTNYLDINRYANSSHGQFMNAALVNSMVLPAPGNNLGLALQWQPVEGFYAMLGVGPNNQDLGQSAWQDVSWDNMSYLAEFGLVAKDFCGLGPGALRVQPFIATFQGDVGGGVGLNVEQQLGADSPLGVFARVGAGDNTTGSVPGSVKAQASAGLALLAPFTGRGWFSAPNDHFAGLGFVWTHPVDDPALDHQDEYAVELTVAIQLTPTTTIQPDLQWVWDPVNNPDSGPATVFQIQLNIAW